jgi:hypothetical protein
MAVNLFYELTIVLAGNSMRVAIHSKIPISKI